MMTQDDMALVREFAASQSEPAFTELVRRHIGLVHSAAVRRVGDAHLAEEVTQAVFVLLARKAGTLGSNTILSGWLYRTAGYVAADALKIQRRREHREQEACMQSTMNEPETPVWREIAPLLESAMDALNERDRNAVLLRFFEDKTLAEVAAAAGVSEDAARVRVNRALEKLHHYFSRHGISSTTAMLAGAISSHSVQTVPAALTKAVTAAALAKGATASISTLTLIKGALKIMAWTKTKTTVVAGVVVLLAAGTATPIAVHHFRVGGGSISSIHIRGQMRTNPNDNFTAVSADADFVTVELWKQFSPGMAWRVEKPGRVAVMDGQTTLAYIKAMNMAVKFPQPEHDAFDTSWFHALAEFPSTLSNELKVASVKGWKVNTNTTWTTGKKESVVTIEVKSDLPDSSIQKNHSVETSDRRDVYRFNDRTKRLDLVQMFLVEPAGETLMFESTQFDYNQTINPALFHLDLPADVAWYKEPQKTAGPDPVAKLTADQAARAFFEACGKEDWDAAAKFWAMPINDQLKEYLGGLKIVSLGAAYASAPYPGRFVPYEIELRPQELNIRLSNTNATGRYVLVGSYDRRLQLLEEFKWSNPPPALADGDADAKLGPADVVKAYFQAMASSDWTRLAKFTTEADLANTKRQVEEARKAGTPLPQFDVGEAFWSAENSAYFVKCQMKGTKKFRMAIRNDNPARHWLVDGGL